MLNNKKKNAFTITELVIVIAVIAILAAVLIPTFSNVVEKANESAALQEARSTLTNYLVDDIDANDLLLKVTKGSTDYYFTYINGVYTAVAESAVETTISAYDTTTNIVEGKNYGSAAIYEKN